MASTVWRGNIAFGLVSIPVRLIRGARRERVRFHHVYRPRDTAPEPESHEPEEASGRWTGTRKFDEAARHHESDQTEAVDSIDAPVTRVHQVTVAGPAPHAGAEGLVSRDAIPVNQTVPRAEVLKGFEIEPDRYVTLRPQEVKAMRPETSTTIDLTSFIHVSEIDPVYFDSSYYVVPQPAGEKGLSLLFRALQQTGRGALGQVAMHGREHAVVIRPGDSGLLLHTLFYQNEVHLQDEYKANAELAAPNEVKMAEAFIKVLAAEFNPKELVDKYEARLRALIEERSKAGTAGAKEAPKRQAPVLDIVQALKASLEQARKPAAKETRAAKRPAAKRHQA